MSQSTGLDDQLLKRRKAMVTGMIVLTVALLLGFVFGSWRFLRDMGDFLEDELAARLKSIATLSGDVIESSNLASDIRSGRLSLALPELNSILEKVHEENDLQGVYLVDGFYRLLASSHGLIPAGERLSFLEEDSVAVSSAVTGLPAVAEMQLVAGNRFKSAYAPVSDPFGDVVAVVVVQANADFFKLMRVFQRGLIIGGVVSLGLAVFFSAFLFWAISLLIKTHESLRKSERLAAMGQMAATVAHEIRNPLGIIKGTADVLKSKYGQGQETDELFEYIPSEVRRLNRLVSDFLIFARDRELERNATDLRQSVEKSLISLEGEMRQANVKLEKSFETLPAIRHDGDAINQLILNLALNAIQAMSGGGTLSVSLKRGRKKRARQYVEVAVTDTGCGIEGTSQQVFEPFFTTKTSGSGLGLAICRRLVEKHGGWFEVESVKGSGTTMRFFVPEAM